MKQTKRINILSVAVVMLTVFTMLACHDHPMEGGEYVMGDSVFAVCDNPMVINCEPDKHAIYVQSRGNGWICSNNCEWLRLHTTSGEGDQYVDFEVDKNFNPFARVTFIYLYDKDEPEKYKYIVQVRQEGYLNWLNSTLTDDMLKKHRMGYGYDITGDYMNESSFSEKPIVNYSRIVSRENVVGDIITEDRRFVEEIEEFSGATLTEMASKMYTYNMDESSFAGCGKTSSTTAELFTNKTAEEECGVVRLKQIVTSRTIDFGMLMSQNLSTTDVGNSLLEAEFCEAVNNLKDDNYVDFFKDYGTHLVVSADLGGSLELFVTVNRKSVSTTKESVRSVAKKVFGKTVSSSSTEEKYQDSNTSIDYKAELKVFGGNDEGIRECVKEKEVRQIPEEVLSKWQQSIKLNTDKNADGNVVYNAALVDCRLIPLYELLQNEELKAKVKTYTLRYVSDSPPTERDEQAHGYFDVKDALAEWDKNGSDGQHQRVMKIGDVAVICKEYVPCIRGDKPCVVAYPMVNGYPFLYCGTFIGDEENRPGAVHWVGNQCYYEPNDSVCFEDSRFRSMFNAETHALERVYLYWSGVQVVPNRFDGLGRKFDCKVGTFDIGAFSANKDNQGHDYVPLVKVGPNFWTEKGVRLADSGSWNDGSTDYKNIADRWRGLTISGERGYYNLVAADYENESLKSKNTKAMRKALPNLVQARSVMAILNGRSEVMSRVDDHGRNMLGLQWDRGFKSVLPTSDRKNTSGVVHDVDTDAWLVLCQDKDGDEVYVTRLGSSGNGTTYTFADYCRALSYSDKRYWKFLPVYISTKEVK